MLNEFKSTLSRSRHTLITDVAGASALVVMLVVGLHLPTLI